ncbi:hypothetical protein [Streptomyces parvus]|uniref:hypothetical protein n=1 Tax=Streptomyces parvus TaxID=66428 RepID=UPI002101B7AC|nr:hypothetical protein [Streptomyces parvus]MCQ1582114.1 hypothetical protein [Streptomyces parvus]
MASSRTKGKGKTSGTLARRKAALERAAERMAEQRRAAEEAEAQRRRKEAEYDELVADFELAVEDEAAAAAEVEKEVARVRERGQVRIDAARVAAARVVLAMGEAGETVAGCGHRLGVGAEKVKELRRLGRERLAAEGSEVAPEKGKADAPGKRTVPKETAGGSGGEQRDGGGAPGRAGTARDGDVAPVAAPPVTAPPAPPAPPAAPARSVPPASAPGVPSPGAPAGPSGAPGGGRPGWPESSG